VDLRENVQRASAASPWSQRQSWSAQSKNQRQNNAPDATARSGVSCDNERKELAN
jgi:hypothetical protein